MNEFNTIYLFFAVNGGDSTSLVEYFDPLTGKWKMVRTFRCFSNFSVLRADLELCFIISW